MMKNIALKVEHARMVDNLVEKILILKDELIIVGSVMRMHKGGIINHARTKNKVLEPKNFERVYSVNELENFIWDIEKYLKATKYPSLSRSQ